MSSLDNVDFTVNDNTASKDRQSNRTNVKQPVKPDGQAFAGDVDCLDDSLTPDKSVLSEQVDTAIFKVQDLALCRFVDGLVDGVVSLSLPKVPDVGVWQPFAKKLRSQAQRCNGNAKAFVSVISAARASEPGFDDLYSQYEEAKKAGQTPVTPAQEVDNITMPDLDAQYLPRPGLSAGVAKWVQEYLEFCHLWSGRGYTGHHEVTAIWLLATIAASRVGIIDGDLTYTPMYAVIVAPSSVWAKTTTAKLPTSLLRQAGLSWLLGSNSTSPEKLLSNMAGKYAPANYDQMSQEEQEIERLRLAHCGQVGWSYSEFGQLLSEMSNDKGRNAPFKHILRVMDDCEEEYVHDTVTRGRETIERPSISLLGTMTPTCMQPYSGTGADSWSNGLYGRFMFACPSPDVFKTREQLKTECRPDRKMVIPDSLVRPLVDWNKRLGVRQCEIEPSGTDKAGNVTGYHVVRGDFPVTEYALAPGVRDTLEDYAIELMLVAQAPELKQLESCYTRLRDKALRVAALVASLEDVDGKHLIEAKHMAYGIELAERCRQDLHNLMAHLNYSPSESAEKALEAAIFDVLRKQNKPTTLREMRQYSKNIDKAAREGRVESKLKELTESGEIIIKKTGRRTEYALPEV